MSGQSTTIVSSAGAAETAALTLKTDLDGYRSFRLGPAMSVADGVPPSDHDSVSSTASAYCTAYADAMDRDAQAFAQIGIELDEADAMAAIRIEARV